MVAVVERGGFLWFCNFFVGFVAFVFFLLILCFLLHMAKVDGYMVRFSRFLYRFGLLSFCLRAFLF